MTLADISRSTFILIETTCETHLYSISSLIIRGSVCDFTGAFIVGGRNLDSKLIFHLL